MLKIVFRTLLLVILSVMLVSCSEQTKKPQNEEEAFNAAKTTYDSAVVRKDKDMFAQSINLYKEFIKNYPNSEKVKNAYNQIAGIYFDNLQNYQEAINTYNEIVAKFPDSKEAKQSLFMVAFIYDETLKDKENAKASYKKFLDKYPTDTDPNDKMSESARVMLEVLESGVSIEEKIKQNTAGEKTSGDTKIKTETADVEKKESDLPPKEQRKQNQNKPKEIQEPKTN